MSDLVIRDLTIEYSSGGYALRPIEGLDLDVASGELVLLLGASGCGKTTLLSVLAGILSPKSGSARFGDVEITELRGSALVEHRRHTVGVIFQAFNLVPSLPAVENVAAPMWAAGVGGRAAKRRATELLTRVGLADRLRHRPGNLSGGQQQRVAIARALALDPPLVLADEPTAHLDALQVESVLSLLRDLAQPGRIVVVATHDERLLPLADRVVELSPRVAGRAAPTEPIVLADGQELFHQGAPSDFVYVVEDGRIELTRELIGGGEEVLLIAEPGHWFGEIGPTYGLPRTASARATGGPATLRAHTVTEFRQRLRTAEV